MAGFEMAIIGRIWVATEVNALQEMERIFAELENSEVFEAFTLAETTRYRDVLSGLRYLIYDLEQDSAEEQLAA